MTGAAASPDDEARVAEYLRAEPDFLIRHPEVLAAMNLPARWKDGDVVDIQQYILDHLRGELKSLRSSAREVIETTRENMSSQARVHAAVLAVLRAEDFEHLLRILSEDLPLLLDVDVVTVGFEPAATPSPALVSAHIRPLPEGVVEAVFGAEKRVVLTGEADDDGTVFSSAAGLVKSAALARLDCGPELPPGLLALGARGAMFHPGQGTELVAFLTQVIERCMLQWLTPAD